jgi:hypothetical protein
MGPEYKDVISNILVKMYRLIRNIYFLTRQAYGDVSEIPDKCLQQLGWVASGIPLEDISNMTVTEIDTIAALGQFHNLSLTQVCICLQINRYVFLH